MKTLLYVSASATDSVSWYRGLGALANLRRMCPQLNIIISKHYSWTTLNMCDGIYMQRPVGEEELEILKMAKMIGRKVWIDHDDDLFNIPTDNMAGAYFQGDKIRQRIVDIAHWADIVSVQSEYLKKWYSEYNKNITVIENAMDVELFKFRTDIPPKRNKVVMWRGSMTHHRDVDTVRVEILDLVKKHPDWMWAFLGDSLWFLSDYIPHDKLILKPAQDVVVYHNFIHQLAPSVVMVPLHDSQFNRNKSNIAWMEASFAGARTVAPKWPQWEQPGVLTYSTPEEFHRNMDTAMTFNVETPAYDSWQTVKEKFNLTKVNEKRFDLLCELFECLPDHLL
jgi:hypothetical protein